VRLLLVLLLAQDAAAALARPLVRAQTGAGVRVQAVPQLSVLPQLKLQQPAPGVSGLVASGLPQLTIISNTPLPGNHSPLESSVSLGLPFDGAGKAKLSDAGDPPSGTFSTPENLKPSLRGPQKNRPEPPKPSRLRRWKKWVIGIVLSAALLAGGAAWYLKPGTDPLPSNPPVVVIGQQEYELAPAAGGHKAPVVSVAPSADGKRRVTVDSTGLWLVTDTLSGAVYAPLKYPGKARAAAFRGDTLMLIDQDGTVRFDGRSIAIKSGKVELAAISTDRQVVAVTNGSKLYILQVKTAAVTGFLMEGRILTVAAAPGEIRVATLRGAMLRLWSIKPGAAPVIVNEKLVPGVTVGVTVINADGTRVAASGGMGSNKGVLSLDWTGKMLLAPNAKFIDSLVVAGLAVSPAGDQVAVLGEDGTLWMWYPDDGDVEELGKIGAGGTIEYGSDGTLYSSDAAGAVRAWPSK
jgi:hypothetical protein